MEKIASFKVDHNTLTEGLYVSRVDRKSGLAVTTIDIRIKRPNEGYFSSAAAHTIEHLGATWLRNSQWKDDIVYFGPMGCLTGFYLIVFGEPDALPIEKIVTMMCHFIYNYSDDHVIGATKEECGNYKLHDLDEAKYVIEQFILTMSIGDFTHYPY